MIDASMDSYVKTKDLVDRWHVDRSSVPAILAAHGIDRSSIHRSPHYSWREVLNRVEHIPLELLNDVKTLQGIIETALLTTAQMADVLCVTTQTVRNYVKTGRLHVIHLTERTPRFRPWNPYENADEVKSASYSKK